MTVEGVARRWAGVAPDMGGGMLPAVHFVDMTLSQDLVSRQGR